jgi:hypothetical protein
MSCAKDLTRHVPSDVVFSDAPDGQTNLNNSVTLEYMKSTFTDHYNGNRQPFGLYMHPIHLSNTVPGASVDPNMIAMINNFLDWAQMQPNGMACLRKFGVTSCDYYYYFSVDRLE